MSKSDPIIYPPLGPPLARAGREPLRVLAVAGGKGGTGKTNLAVNLAVAVADTGRRVLIIDGDAALANVDMLLDVTPRHHLGDVLSGALPIEQVLVESPHGVTLLPASSGILALERLGDDAKLALLAALESLGDAYDVVVIDTASGLSPNTLFFAGAAQEVALVTTPEPTSLVDTYAGLKALARRHGVTRAHLIVNQAGSGVDACEIHQRLAVLARRFLDVQVDLAGWLPFDAHVHRAVIRRTPVLRDAPKSDISRRIRALAGYLLGQDALDSGDRLRFFWRQLLDLPHDGANVGRNADGDR